MAVTILIPTVLRQHAGNQRTLRLVHLECLRQVAIHFLHHDAKPAPGEHWVKAPPHIMVIAPGKLDPAMFSSEPHSGEHWIMYGGTPYEHLMIPVK